MLTRYVINQVASIALGPLTEIAPDLSVVGPPDGEGVSEKDSPSVQGLLFVDMETMTGVIVVLPEELKKQLVGVLTGGVEIATKLPGGLRGL